MNAFRKVILAATCVGSLVAVAAPALAQTTLRAVMHSDLKILDPIWTTAYIVRNHGYMIYDTLLAQDEKGEIKPQMVEKYDTSADKKAYTFTLREGLSWHDGKPVTSEDCIASIKRWASSLISKRRWRVRLSNSSSSWLRRSKSNVASTAELRIRETS